jgi:hypothetical protein
MNLKKSIRVIQTEFMKS